MFLHFLECFVKIWNYTFWQLFLLTDTFSSISMAKYGKKSSHLVTQCISFNHYNLSFSLHVSVFVFSSHKSSSHILSQNQSFLDETIDSPFPFSFKFFVTQVWPNRLNQCQIVSGFSSRNWFLTRQREGGRILTYYFFN